MAADPRQLPIPEQIAYYALREIWRRRDEMTPSGEMQWRDWWEQRFGNGRTCEDAAKEYGRRQ